VATAVIGVALKDTLARFFAGVALGKMVKVGDWVSTLDKEGRVTHIGMEHVTLMTREQDHIILPNDNVIQAGIVNYSRPTTTHVCWIDVEAAYRFAPVEVLPVLTEAAVAVQGVVETPPPIAIVADFRESGILYRLAFSIEDYANHPRIKSQVRAYVWNAFHRSGIEIPFPQRVVHHEAGPDRTALPALTNAHLASRLGSLDLFSCLSAAQLSHLAEDSTVEHYLQGERVVRQGDEGDALYVVLGGRAEVTVQHETLKKNVGSIEPGQCFGEMSLLTGERRKATVTALTDLDVLAVGHEAILKVLQEDKTLVEKIGAIVAGRQSTTQAAKDQLTKEHASLVLSGQQRTLVERIQNYLWGDRSRNRARGR
jgi:CRP-like cAMP-binding protein